MSEPVHRPRRRSRALAVEPVAPDGESTIPPERLALAERILALLRAEVPAGDLAREIEALRQVLGEVLMAEPDPRKLVGHVARLVDVEVRALRAQRLLEGTKSAAFAESLTQLLLELGLGGEGEAP